MTREEWVQRYVHDAEPLSKQQVRDLCAIFRLPPARYGL